MEWRDEGVVIGVRGHGETSAIAEILTAEHGRCLGMVRGGRSRQMRPVLQPGNLVMVTWRARLEDHLGVFQLEPLALKAGFILSYPFRLAGLSTLMALAQMLPEREPHPRLYHAAHIVLSAIEDDAVWPALLVRWEMGLLDELGFGLDLAKCAATGSAEELHYVSPRTGRAVSREAGQPYQDRLFSLPGFLRGDGEFLLGDVLAGLKLTGYFLERHVFGPRAIAMPQSRQWFADGLAERALAC
jgi:DNA repair protein RecO (recombination protein O)